MSRGQYAVNRYNEEYYWTTYILSMDVEGSRHMPITGGSIEHSEASEVKYSGSITTRHDGTAVGDLVFARVHHAFDTDEHGHVDDLLGTFVVTTSSRTTSGLWDDIYSRYAEDEYSMTLYSLLRIPQARLISSPMTIRKGTAIVDKAKAMLEGLGLTVSTVSQPGSTSTLQQDVVYDPGESYLGIVNDLLGRVGWSLRMSADGTVDLAKSHQATGAVWRDDEDSVMVKGIAIEDNAGDRANVVRGHCSTSEANFWVVAKNNDEGCKASLAIRQGVEVSEMLDMGEIEWEYDGTYASEVALKGYIMDAARAALTRAATEVEHVKVTAASGAANVGDSLRVVLDGIDKSGTVTNVSMSLEPGATADYQMRSVYVPDESKYTITTGVY